MIRRLVLDVLKPHEPGMADIATGLMDRLTIDGITATLVEIDENVRAIRIVMEGEELDLDEIETAINDLGGSIHSIDQVSCGEQLIDDIPIDN